MGRPADLAPGSPVLGRQGDGSGPSSTREDVDSRSDRPRPGGVRNPSPDRHPQGRRLPERCSAAGARSRLEGRRPPAHPRIGRATASVPRSSGCRREHRRKLRPVRSVDPKGTICTDGADGNDDLSGRVRPRADFGLERGGKREDARSPPRSATVRVSTDRSTDRSGESQRPPRPPPPPINWRRSSI